jgi:hypothetical protein
MSEILDVCCVKNALLMLRSSTQRPPLSPIKGTVTVVVVLVYSLLYYLALKGKLIFVNHQPLPYCATGTIKGTKETEPMFVFALLKPDPRELNALEEMFKSTDLDLPIFEGSCYSAPFTEFKCNNARVTSLFIVLR